MLRFGWAWDRHREWEKRAKMWSWNIHFGCLSGVLKQFEPFFRFGSCYDVDMIWLSIFPITIQKQREIKRETESEWKKHSTSRLEHEDVHDEGTRRRNSEQKTLCEWLVFTHLIWLNHTEACQRSWSEFSKMHGAIKVHANEVKRTKPKQSAEWNSMKMDETMYGVYDARISHLK